VARIESSMSSRLAMTSTTGAADRGHMELDSTLSADDSSLALSQQSPAPVQHPQTRLSRGIRHPQIYTDGTIRYGMLSSPREQSSLDVALNDPNWKQAMDAKFEALMKNNTWHLVPPQKGMNIIDSKWV
jgi:hypothetical protein